MSLRAEGGGGDRPIAVHPDDFDSVAGKFATGQDNLDKAASALTTALRNAAAMAGNDDYGHNFARKYDPAAKALFTAWSRWAATASSWAPTPPPGNPRKGRRPAQLRLLLC